MGGAALTALLVSDQIKSPVPFFAISQALSGLSRQLLAESENELVVWRRRLSKVLAKEGRVLAEVLPALEHVFQPGWLDSLPPIIVLGPAESEKRFQDLVQRVLRVFARGGRPLVIMFGTFYSSSLLHAWTAGRKR